MLLVARMEALYEVIDRERMSVPTWMRDNRNCSPCTIVSLRRRSADAAPLYFPCWRRLMVAAGDAHVHDEGALDGLINKVEPPVKRPGVLPVMLEPRS